MIIEPEKYSEAQRFLETFEPNASIDLHEGARHLDKLSYRELFARSKIIRCGAARIRVLSPEDHLRVVCVHWLNDGGAKKEKLWDIYYAVANRPPDFDWDWCLNAAGATRKKWIVCAIAVTRKYLGLNLEDTPLAEPLAEIPRWLTKALEKEWQSAVKLKSLHNCLRDRKELWRQIKKRIPPNPIQATVEMEGEFDEQPRLFYQLGDILLRLAPSLKRMLRLR